MRALTFTALLAVTACSSGLTFPTTVSPGLVLGGGATRSLDLGDVRRGCGRHDVVMVTSFSAAVLRITDVSSSSPLVTVKSAGGVVTSGAQVAIEVDIEAPTDATGFVRGIITVTTDSGAPLEFDVQALVTDSSATSFDFGGVLTATRATAHVRNPAPLAMVEPTVLAFGTLTFAGFAPVGLNEPFLDLVAEPALPGHLQDSAPLNMFRHCPGAETFRAQLDSRDSVLTPAQFDVDFGDVAQGSVSKKQVALENWSAEALRPQLSMHVAEFSNSLVGQTLPPASRDDAGVLHPSVTLIELQFKPTVKGPQLEAQTARATSWEVEHTVTFSLRGSGIP